MACIRCGFSHTSNCPYCSSTGSMPSVEEMRTIRKTSEELGRKTVEYFPILVAVFASIYIPYRIAMALGMGDDLETMPHWIGIVGTCIGIAALVFRKFILGRIGWIATLIFVTWFILSPDFVSRVEQARLDNNSVIRTLEAYAQSVTSCKRMMTKQGSISTATFNTMVEQCNDREKKFLEIVASSTDEQLNSICRAKFRATLAPAVVAVCTSRNL